MEEHNKAQTQKIKHHSLRFGIIWLVVLCWVLPMILTIIISGVLFYNSAVNRATEIVIAQIEHTAAIVQRDLDNLVDTLLNIGYDNSLRRAYREYERSGNDVELILFTQDYIERKFSRNQLVRAAFVVYPGFGSIKYRDGSQITWRDTQSFDSTEIFANADDLIEDLGSEVRFQYENDKLYLYRVMSLPQVGYRPFALMAVDVNFTNLFESVRGQPLATNAAAQINDIEFDIQGEPVQWQNTMQPVGITRSIDGNMFTVTLQTSANRYSFKFAVSTDISPLVEQASSNVMVFIIVAVFSVVLVAFALQYIRRRVNHPITELSTLAAQVEKGNFGVQCDVQDMRNTEFVYLATQMNDMSAKLKNQFERIYREEIAARDAQIKALQSQINPHFLGNTLEIINWEARLARDEKSSRMMEALSTLLRATQNRNHQQLIPLEEEMTFIDSYLYITQQRFGKRLQVRKEIDDKLMNWMVPRLILQPLVENAIEHGVTLHRHGKVVIRAVQRDESSIYLEVENDAPMSAEDEQKVQMLLDLDSVDAQGAVNIGIRNVHLRLKLIFGDESGLTISNTGDGSTISCIRIMKHTEGQEEKETKNDEN